MPCSAICDFEGLPLEKQNVVPADPTNKEEILMRVRQSLIAAVVMAGLPGAAMAQTTTAAPAAVPVANSSIIATVPSQWIASGFVGSNFGASANQASASFGAQIGYLYHGYVGGAFLADFSPSFRIDNALLASHPNVNSYMANVIGALPLGADGQYQPYVSGGLGSIQLRSDVLNVSTPGSVSSDQAKFGGNLGIGITGYEGNVGVRADVRYYHAFNTSTVAQANPADAFAQGLLSGLSFWRANVGVALRW
jgi:hypothetical protein